MEEIMIGTLYIVTNDINNKIYIGKTYQSLEDRWKRHVYDSKRIDRRTSGKFHVAINKYGAEHFKIQKITQFEEGTLEQKEIEYIAKYDSFNNGYNSTLGGEGARLIDFSKSDILTIINAFDNGESINNIARTFDVSSYTIKNIVCQNGRSVQSFDDVAVVRYSLDNKYIKTYNTIKDAVPDILNDGYSADLRNLYRYIHEACETGCTRYGSKWKLLKSLSNEEININNTTINLGKSLKNSRVKRDSNGVTCIELNIKFNTFKDAAQYLVDNGYAQDKNIQSLAYKISQAKRSNKKCYELTWI
jgi:hypothetical protein